MARTPKNYLGTRHETLGSDILAILHALTFPEAVLGRETAARVEAIDANGWYPIGWFLELMELLDGRIGTAGLIKMGRKLYELSHEARLSETARCARDVVYGIDGMYHHANRGTQIGGWQVQSFEPGIALLEKTTPHHCMMEQGILDRALIAVGAPSRVAQLACFRKGADACLFQVTSDVRGARWGGAR